MRKAAFIAYGTIYVTTALIAIQIIISACEVLAPVHNGIRSLLIGLPLCRHNCVFGGHRGRHTIPLYKGIAKFGGIIFGLHNRCAILVVDRRNVAAAVRVPSQRIAVAGEVDFNHGAAVRRNGQLRNCTLGKTFVLHIFRFRRRFACSARTIFGFGQRVPIIVHVLLIPVDRVRDLITLIGDSSLQIACNGSLIEDQFCRIRSIPRDCRDRNCFVIRLTDDNGFLVIGGSFRSVGIPVMYRDRGCGNFFPLRFHGQIGLHIGKHLVPSLKGISLTVGNFGSNGVFSCLNFLFDNNVRRLRIIVIIVAVLEGNGIHHRFIQHNGLVGVRCIVRISRRNRISCRLGGRGSLRLSGRGGLRLSGRGSLRLRIRFRLGFRDSLRLRIRLRFRFGLRSGFGFNHRLRIGFRYRISLRHTFRCHITDFPCGGRDACIFAFREDLDGRNGSQHREDQHHADHAACFVP